MFQFLASGLENSYFLPRFPEEPYVAAAAYFVCTVGQVIPDSLKLSHTMAYHSSILFWSTEHKVHQNANDDGLY